MERCVSVAAAANWHLAGRLAVVEDSARVDQHWVDVEELDKTVGETVI